MPETDCDFTFQLQVFQTWCGWIRYRQVITWVATVTSPLMPLLTFVVANYLMMIEFLALQHVYRPPEHPWSAVKTVTSFLKLTFVSMLVSMVPFAVWATNVRRCGPFEGIRPVDSPVVIVSNMLYNMTCKFAVENPSVQVECADFPRAQCMAHALDCVWSPAEASSVVLYASAVGQVVISIPFLLAVIFLVSLSHIMEQARLKRWKHEVALLRETADGERKFLVKKLHNLHLQIQREILATYVSVVTATLHVAKIFR
eukprot:COSAG01_NODE_5715_length_4082_cov_2.185287_2_plen_257_part_00